MAPDINSVHAPLRDGPPQNLESLPSSRRASQSSGPSHPIASARDSIASMAPITIGTSSVGSLDNTGVGNGPGPLRHPRPLTAADLHLQLEKEQEAVVNRLTRELSQLRQQTASVTSTASSTSTGFLDPSEHNAHHLLSGPNRPTYSRRHRSSSSLSTRSINTPSTTTGSLGGTGSNPTSTSVENVIGSTVSGIAPARDFNTPHPLPVREPLSRQDSLASSRRSGASSPSWMARSPSLNSGVSTSRYEEVTHHRSELEAVRRENEALRRRIRDLERNLRSHRQSTVYRNRSESASTSASTAPAEGSS